MCGAPSRLMGAHGHAMGRAWCASTGRSRERKSAGLDLYFWIRKQRVVTPIGKLHPTSVHDARSQDGVRYFTLQNVHAVYNTMYELSCTRVLHSFMVHRNHKACIALWIS